MLGIVFVLIGYAFWPGQSPIPVLIYHDISTSTRPTDSYTVESDLLERELDHLIANGYTPLTFVSAELLRAENKLPKRPIILTFDDGLPGQNVALALLRSRNTSATFFISSDLIGDSVHLNWEQVRAIAAAGMEIGGHSANHVHVPELNETGLLNEVTGDKHRIESEIGKPITVFAYPFQEKSDAGDAEVARAGYTIIRDTAEYKSTVMTNSFEAFLGAL